METLASIIESILFVSGNEVAVKDISDKLGIPEKDILNEAKKLQEKKYGDGSGADSTEWRAVISADDSDLLPSFDPSVRSFIDDAIERFRSLIDPGEVCLQAVVIGRTVVLPVFDNALSDLTQLLAIGQDRFVGRQGSDSLPPPLWMVRVVQIDLQGGLLNRFRPLGRTLSV